MKRRILPDTNESTALGHHNFESAVRILQEIGVENELATVVVEKLAGMSQAEAERRIARLIAGGGDPRNDNVLTAYLILKHT